MALTNAWQEAYPDNDNFGFELDDYQRQIRTDVRERLAVQHKAYLDETGHTDVGEHTPGECTVSYIGTKSTFPVPSTATKGCIAIATDEANQQYYWTGTAWSKVQEPMLITGGDQTIAGVKTFADIKASADIDIGPFNFRAQTLESDVITGTPPLVVASTTKVENLNVDNADNLDGKHGNEQFGAWATKASNTTYLAETDGFAVGVMISQASGVMYGYTHATEATVTNMDSSAMRIAACHDAVQASVGFNMPVRKGDYWRIYSTTLLTVSWLPIGVPDV